MATIYSVKRSRHNALCMVYLGELQVFKQSDSNGLWQDESVGDFPRIQETNQTALLKGQLVEQVYDSYHEKTQSSESNFIKSKFSAFNTEFSHY